MVDFIFDGQSLSDHGYMICSFDSLDMQRVPVSSDTFNTIRAPLSYRSKRTSVEIGENLTTTIQICKNVCENDYDTEMSIDEVSEITRWLCRREYKPFQEIMGENDVTNINDVQYNVQIVANKITWHDKILGLELTINNDSPFAYTSKIKASFDYTTSFRVNVMSDEEGYLYPKMTIVLGESGDLNLTNTTTGDVTTIKNCSNGEIINIYDDIMQLDSSISSHDLYADFNYVFPRFKTVYNHYDNAFESNLSIAVVAEYQGLRKVGI